MRERFAPSLGKGEILKKEDVMESCKVQLKTHVDLLIDHGVRKANIEIELLHYLKKLLYSDGH